MYLLSIKEAEGESDRIVANDMDGGQAAAPAAAPVHTVGSIQLAPPGNFDLTRVSGQNG